MKKYFVAFRFTGEDPNKLETFLDKVVSALSEAGVDPYCNFFDKENLQNKNSLTNRQIMDKAFSKINDSDGLFVVISSSNKSEGQLMEVGYAYAKNKKIVAAIKKGTDGYMREMANKVIEWETVEELSKKIIEAGL